MSILQRKKLLTGCTLFLACVVAGVNVNSNDVQACSTLSECRREIDGAKSRREQLQKEIDAIKIQTKNIEAEIYNLQLQIATFNAQIDAATKTIEALEIQSVKLAQSMKETEQLLRRRLVEMQLAMETNKSLNFVADSSSITQMIERAQAINALTKSDQELIIKYDNEKKEVDRNKEITIATKKELESYKAEKDKLLQENAAKLEDFRKQQEAYDKAINDTKSSEQLSEQQIAAIKAAANRVPVYGGGGERASFDGGYPLEHAVLTSHFAEQDSAHPIPHNGTDYAPLGNPTVYSMVDGVVVYNTFNGARGNMIAIAFQDNGGWKTLMYQHLASRSGLAIGTAVKRGQAVGIAGNTGMSFGVHLHAEVSVAGPGPSWISRGGSPEAGQYAIERYFNLPSRW